MHKHSYIKLLRPSNWIKNFLVALPLVLSGKFDFDSILTGLTGFFCFSFLSSAVYILNDIRDIENDRAHKVKYKRPLAAAEVKVEHAFIMFLGLLIVAFTSNEMLLHKGTWILVLYFVLNYFYSVWGKKIRFIDIILLCFFYLSRVVYGGYITGTELTGWFMATITMAVLSVAIHKRYMECSRSVSQRLLGRAYVKEDAPFLKQLMFGFAIMAHIFLNMHAFIVLGIGSPYFYCLLNITAAGIMFFYFDEREIQSEDPVERILKNKKLFILLLFFFALYSYEIIIHNK